MLDELGGIAGDNGERFDVFRHHRAGGDDRAFSNRHARQNNRPRPDPHAVADCDRRGDERTVWLGDVVACSAYKRRAKRRRDSLVGIEKQHPWCLELVVSQDPVALFRELAVPLELHDLASKLCRYFKRTVCTPRIHNHDMPKRLDVLKAPWQIPFLVLDRNDNR